MTCYKEFDNWNTVDTLVTLSYSEMAIPASLHILFVLATASAHFINF